jgi:hypothetical protein
MYYLKFLELEFSNFGIINYFCLLDNVWHPFLSLINVLYLSDNVSWYIFSNLNYRVKNLYGQQFIS